MESNLANQRNLSTTSSDKFQQRKLSIMVLVFVGVFIVCNLPDAIFWMKYTYGDKTELNSLACFSEFAEVLNASVNVIVYR